MSQDNDKKIRIGKKVLSEDELEFQVQYEGEVFTLKYPTPFELAMIASDVAQRLGGFTRQSFPVEHLMMIEAHAYVDHLVVPEKCPSWFKSAWTCYDDRCVNKLYEGYLQFRGKFQERIRSDEPEGRGKG